MRRTLGKTLFALHHRNIKTFVLRLVAFLSIRTFLILLLAQTESHYVNVVEKSVVEFKCPYKIKGKSVIDAFKETDFLEERDGTIHLKTSHRYYSQVQCQMAVAKANKCFFCVWTGHGLLFVESIAFDDTMWREAEQDLVLFYKNYVAKVLFGIRTIYYCPECQKLCLDDGEIEKDEENVVCWDKCDLWFHWGCVGFTEEMAASNFTCRACKQGFERLL